MLISHKHKFITIDIPKTGTASIRKSLYPLGIIDICGVADGRARYYQHGTANQCKHALQQDGIAYDNYYTFCVVRNPWDRYYSFFKYFKMYARMYVDRDSKINWNQPQLRQGESCVNLFKNKTDIQVLEELISSKPAQEHYYTSLGDIIVDHIAEFSNLSNEFKNFCKHVGLSESPSLPHANKSDPMECQYTQRLIDMVAEKESHVISLMNYKYTK